MVMVDRVADLQGRAGETARELLQWWLGALSEMVPTALRRRVTSLRSRLVLEQGEAGFALVRYTGDQRESLGAVDLDSPQSVRHGLAAAGQAWSDRGVDVALNLPAERALKAAIFLPLAAERNLDQVIGFEFERVVPFKRDEAYYTYRVVGRDRAARNLHAEITVVRRADIDPIIGAANRCGLHLTGLEVASIGRADPTAVIALAGSRRTSPSHARGIILALSCLALLLAIAGIAVPFVKAESVLSTLSREVAAARHNAEQSAALEAQIEAQRQDRDFLMDRRRAHPTATELLDALTRLTPDDSWLDELRIDGDEVELSGASASATNLLSLIDQSPRFSDAAFRASITRDAGLGREHFDISAKIAPQEAK